MPTKAKSKKDRKKRKEEELEEAQRELENCAKDPTAKWNS